MSVACFCMFEFIVCLQMIVYLMDRYVSSVSVTFEKRFGPVFIFQHLKKKKSFLCHFLRQLLINRISIYWSHCQMVA